MKVCSSIALALAGAATASTALADPRLDEKVYDPYVKNHVLELEVRTGGETGGPFGGSRTYVGEVEYGVNDRLSLAVIGKLTNGAGESADFRGLGLEGVYYIGQIPLTGIDAGAYLEYAKGFNGGDDVVEAKLLAARQFGPIQAVANLIMERPLNVADEHFASYGYAASATWQPAPAWRLGAQAFGELGSDHGFLSGPQGAYVGPTAQWELRPAGSPFEIELNASWLKAVGPNRAEADSQFRLVVELERRF
jgi:hypothetical protein